ncbi:MAG TPA: PfkB family carbohydrate kinase [Candidatus Nanoarchaeia archaeon]|nr:PfkB family carbohydrate kinase [Candidatus Nanoarchaeia archaeon]
MDNREYIKEIRDKFSLEEIKNILDSCGSKKVLVVGDTIIDEYCFVEPRGGSAKDPMMTVDYLNEEVYAGGILAIANHVSNFAGSVRLVTLLGDRADFKNFVVSKLNKRISPTFFVKDNSPTVRKRRYIRNTRNENEKLFMIEDLNPSHISENLEKEIIAFLERELPNHDLVIVGDFGHGFITDKIIKTLEEKSSYLAVNVQTNSANLGFNYVTKYSNPSFLTMDGTELALAMGEKLKDFLTLMNTLHERKKYNRFLVTLGKEGAAYFNHGKIHTSPAFVSKVTDIVGAGDAVLSVASLLSLSEVEEELILFIANCVGGIAVSIMGNEKSIAKEELLAFIEELYTSIDHREIDYYFNSVNDTLNNLDKKNIFQFAELLLETYEKDKVIYVFGNGGSAATASHFCGDLVKGVSYGLDKRFRVICLNDNTPAVMAIANDISYDDIFVEQLKNFLRKDDVVIGISGSGNSINVLKAIEYANSAGAKTVAICGYKGGKIKDIASLAVHAEVNDMEISEDIHNLVITHCVKRILTNRLNNTNVGEVYAKRVS